MAALGLGLGLPLGTSLHQGMDYMGQMKTLLLEAAIAIEKVLEADGTIEQVLETVDQVSDIRVTTMDRETR